MNEFIEKWNTDSKFKAKVKLGLYGVFMLIAVIFAFASRSTIDYTNESFSEKDNETKIVSINIPEKYNYSINIELNDKEFKYVGTKNDEQETIQKTVNDSTNQYIKKNDTYYKNSIIISNIIEQDEVYDIIDYNYLDLDTINKYLSIAKEDNNNQYIVYLKDIILGNNSEKYITIKIDKNKVNIDYTSLMTLFDKTIERSNVEIIIEEIE